MSFPARRAVGFVVLGTGLFLAGTQFGATTAAQDKADSRLKQLQRERLQLRQKAADMVRQLSTAGRPAGVVEVIEADLAALRVELDLADTKDARVAVWEKIVAQEKQREKLLSSDMGLSGLERIDIRVRRIDAEIGLERARG
jgi:hypothetical protein